MVINVPNALKVLEYRNSVLNVQVILLLTMVNASVALIKEVVKNAIIQDVLNVARDISVPEKQMINHINARNVDLL